MPCAQKIGLTNWGQIPIVFLVQGAFGLLACFWGTVFIFRGLAAMVVMCRTWVLAMLAVNVLALLPVEHLQLPIF